MRILHVLDRLTGAGPSRGIVTLAREQRCLGLGYEHRLVTLHRAGYPVMLLQARQAGITVRRAPDLDALRSEIAAADIVQLHYWQTPAIESLLATDLPDHHRLVQLQIVGDCAPQVLSKRLGECADHFVCINPRSLELPALQAATGAGRVSTILPAPDPKRLAGVRAEPHSGFNVGYIGTLNANKLHPEFVSMSAAVDLPDVRFLVCGGEAPHLRAEVARLGAANRFEFLGFVEDVGSVLARLDVFGYPLAPETYAAVDQALQEAMTAGLPTVAFESAPAALLLRHGETGLVVRTPTEYSAAIEHLARNPDLRKRLGRNAQLEAGRRFSAASNARSFADVYRRVAAMPRRSHRCPGPTPSEAPGRYFADLMVDAAPWFARSLAGADNEAERRIAGSTTLLARGEGGLVQYRNAYPDDPYLRFWTGLVLRREGRLQAARLELEAAVRLGLDRDAAGRYLRPAVGVAGDA